MTTAKEQFDVWWREEGSAITPEFADTDHEEHAHRVSEIAWMNGVCCECNRWRNAAHGIMASMKRFLREGDNHE